MYLVADIGCGKKKYPNAIGLDISKDSNADVIGDMTRLPFKDKIFDMVLLNESLEHVEEIGVALTEAIRVMKKEGKLELVLPTKNPFFILKKTIGGCLTFMG
jgi:ubiquinone/menaquinone biosynthesis C-methylase UbiE